MAAPVQAALDILTTQIGFRFYADYGTGSKYNLAVFQPTIPRGYYMIGHFAQRDYNDFMMGSSPLVKPLLPDAVSHPVNYIQIWNDKGTGGRQDVSFWRPIPKQGYICLGDLVNLGYGPPTHLTSRYACIQSDLVERATSGHLIWNDKKSGSKDDTSMWAVQPLTSNQDGIGGFFRAVKGFNRPNPDIFYSLDGNTITGTTTQSSTGLDTK